MPSVSISVDLPTPGAPVMPTRTALPVAGSSSCDQGAGGAAMVGPLALDQGDRARQHRAIAGANAAGEAGDVDRLAA